MGMYDMVEFRPPIVCFRCESELDGFQTKDSPDQSLYTRLIRDNELIPEVTIRAKVHPLTLSVEREEQSFLAEDTPAMTWLCYTVCVACQWWNEYELTIHNNVVISRRLIARPQSPYDLQG